LAALARADPERVALVCGESRMTFAALDRAANGVAHALAVFVTRPGDRVAIVLGNGIPAFAAWHGAARLGTLVVPTSTRLTASEAAYILDDSGAVVVVHDGAPAALAAAAQAGVPAVDVTDPAVAAGRDDPPTEDYLGTPVTTMTYTSGTTGRPKGITRPAPAPARQAPANPFAAFWGFLPDDVHLMCGPMYHTAPSAYALMSLAEGGRVVVMERFDATECLRLIATERVTTSQMVPANFIRILEADWRGYDRSSVRKILHAAAPCPVAVKRRVMEVFPPDTVWEYYGASEGMASVISPDEWLAKPGSVGRPFPGLSVRIVGPEGDVLPTGEIGAIYVSSLGPARFSYHNAPDKTEQAWLDDYFTVGDLGRLDEDGYLFLADRRTDLILSGGVNVYPAEVEAALVEEDDVVDAAVFGLPDERMGQKVHAVVELRPGADRDADGLRARLAVRLADFKLPRTIEFVDELPREPNGKVLKSKLREERMEVVT
jgi:long-chain acyl-CoA synthetase